MEDEDRPPQPAPQWREQETIVPALSRKFAGARELANIKNPRVSKNTGIFMALWWALSDLNGGPRDYEF
jgi:hypothetical protein